MKTSVLTRIYALAMSILFATVATVGVAVMMASGSEQGSKAFSASAAAQQGSAPAQAQLGQRHDPAGSARQVL